MKEEKIEYNTKIKREWIYTVTTPIRLHGIVLNQLITETTLPFLPFHSINWAVPVVEALYDFNEMGNAFQVVIIRTKFRLQKR
jgi:hypothetical protein